MSSPPPLLPPSSASPDPAPSNGHSHASRERGKKAKNNLLALGSAAVLAVYFAGYIRTRSAASRFDGEGAGRRPATSPETIATAPAIVAQPTVTSTPPTNPAPAIAKILPPEATPATPVAPVSKATVEIAAIPSPSPTPPSVPTTAAIAAVPIATTPSPNAALPATAPVVVTMAAASPAAAAPAVEKQPKWKDGIFAGWGSCRHGDIEATVEIKAGRIISATITSCRTRYACDVIDRIIPQVVARQSADVDTVSGATQSADAFYWAVTQALAKAAPGAVAAQ